MEDYDKLEENSSFDESHTDLLSPDNFNEKLKLYNYTSRME